MQDSFLAAFTKLNDLNDAKIFGTWLKRIVINNSIYHYKKKSKYQEVALNEDNNKISLAGYGDLWNEDAINADNLDVALAGSGDLTLDINTASADASIAALEIFMVLIYKLIIPMFQLLALVMPR